jgi:hypothetical protein
VIDPPPEGTEARHWWDKGAEDEAAIRDEGLCDDVREMRNCLEWLARRSNATDEDGPGIAADLAVICLADRPLAERIQLAFRLVFR